VKRMRRYCKCGCGGRLSGKQRLWASEGCRKAHERGGVSGFADRTRTRPKPSGVQLSYWRTRALMRMRLVAAARRKSTDTLTLNEALCVSLSVLDDALPDRQKQALAQRDTNQRRRAA